MHFNHKTLQDFLVGAPMMMMTSKQPSSPSFPFPSNPSLSTSFPSSSLPPAPQPPPEKEISLIYAPEQSAPSLAPEGGEASLYPSDPDKYNLQEYAPGPYGLISRNAALGRFLMNC